MDKIYITVPKKHYSPESPMGVRIGEDGQECMVRSVREGMIYANGINTGRYAMGAKALTIEIDARFDKPV